MQVRDALANLYDPVALQAHSLTGILVDTRKRLDSPQGGAALRERLLAAIERLKPGPHVDPVARVWRPYQILQLRYIEARDPGEIQHRLAMSKSQYYRDHESAHAALVALLWEDVQAGYPVQTDLEEPDGALVGRDRTAVLIGAEAHALPKPGTGLPRRWLVIGGCTLAVVVALSAVFCNRSTPAHPTGAKASPRANASATSLPQRAGVVGATSLAPTLSVYAGNGQPGYANGAAAQARFNGPFGLSVDRNGTVYVADTGNNRIRMIISSGLVLDVAGSGVAGYADGPAASAQFSAPNAVTVVPDGTVYIGDAGNLRIRAVSPAGTVTTLAGSGVAGYVDGVGTGAHFTATGTVISDGAGNVYVPDRQDNVIRKITPAGGVSTYAGSGVRGHQDGPATTAQFNSPQRGGGVDAAGNVYILDTGDYRIRKISPQGTVSTVAGTGVFGFSDGPAAQAQFSSDIQGVITDDAGTLYVMDAGNRRIRKVAPDGTVSTLYQFTDPGQSPGNIKVDRAGNLYISDREHNVIYKLTVSRER